MIGDSAVLAILALPSLVVLVTALVFYIEHRDNMWKQLRTTPQHPASIYAGKFVLIQGDHPGQRSCVRSPSGRWAGRSCPLDARALIPVSDGEVRALLATVAAEVYVALLPVALIQFVLSARLPNVLHPVGIGLGVTFASLLMYGPSTGRVLPLRVPGRGRDEPFRQPGLPEDAGQVPDLAYRAKDDAFGPREAQVGYPRRCGARQSAFGARFRCHGDASVDPASRGARGLHRARWRDSLVGDDPRECPSPGCRRRSGA